MSYGRILDISAIMYNSLTIEFSTIAQNFYSGNSILSIVWIRYCKNGYFHEVFIFAFFANLERLAKLKTRENGFLGRCRCHLIYYMLILLNK